LEADGCFAHGATAERSPPQMSALPSAVHSGRIILEQQLLECDRICGELEDDITDDVLSVPDVRSSEDDRASGLGLVLKAVAGQVVVGDTVPGGDRLCTRKRRAV
jgi:hypothetical protein